MIEFIVIIIIYFIALFSAGYRMDEQFRLSSGLSNKHRVRLNKKLKKCCFLKDKSRRDYFLSVAVAQQFIAYLMLTANIMVLLICDLQKCLLLAMDINLYFMAVDLLLVVVIGLFYKLKKQLVIQKVYKLKNVNGVIQ